MLCAWVAQCWGGQFSNFLFTKFTHCTCTKYRKKKGVCRREGRGVGGGGWGWERGFVYKIGG